MISDHPLSTSGVGCQARYLIDGLLRTGKYSFRCLGAAIKHKDYDVVKVNEDFVIRPIDGFGDKNLLRFLLATERPDALFLFTDPRFFNHVWEIEDEIHQVCPIVYWHVWDNDPWPYFNDAMYDCVDLINCHSHKTYGMVHEHFPEKTNFIPHAIPSGLFHSFDDTTKIETKKKILGEDKSDHFVGLWVNRNARRKMPNDVLESWSMFLDELEKKEGHKKATLIMHTDPLDQEGPNLFLTSEMLGIKDHVMFSTDRIEFQQMNVLHNISDFYINIACYPAGEKVVTKSGVKEIQDIAINDLVLTHNGKYQKVVDTFSRNLINESIFEIKSSNNPKIRITGEHPVLAIKKKDCKFLINENLKNFRDLASFVKVKDLNVGDYVVYQAPDKREKKDLTIMSSDYLDVDYELDENDVYRTYKNYPNAKNNVKVFIGNDEIVVDEDLAYIFGNWIADGSTNSTSVSFNKKDKDKAQLLCEKYDKKLGGGKIYEAKKVLLVSSRGKGESLYSKMFTELCGRYSAGKKIPDLIFDSSEDIKKSFLDGLVAGDGCILKNGDAKITRIRTISNDLMIGLKNLLINLGYVPSVVEEDNSKGYGNGKIWCIEWRERKRKNNGSCRSWNVNNSVISRIYEINEVKNQTSLVYNFEVENDNSYNNISFSSHNCNEGFGLGTLEAMMCKNPIIALKTGGMIRQVVDHRDGSENGIALEPDVRNLVGSQLVPFIYEDHISNKKIADAIFKMWSWGPKKRKEMGEKAYSYARSEFDIGNTIQKWDETMYDCITNWRKRRKSWTLTEL